MNEPRLPLEIAIFDLRDRPSLLPSVMEWHADACGKFRSRPEIEAMHRGSLRGAADSCTLVGLIADVPAGMASLRPFDQFHRLHCHLTPWLDSVYVARAQRRRGVGAALCRAVIEQVAGAGFSTLYLGTDGPAAARLYVGLGFTELESTSDYGETPHLLMRLALDRPA